jgi:hypothetical protein
MSHQCVHRVPAMAEEYASQLDVHVELLGGVMGSSDVPRYDLRRHVRLLPAELPQGGDG